jgi:beta-galactosidase/beta-glucuronidase
MPLLNDVSGIVPVAATRLDGSYPRPALVRSAWVDLCGPWAFTFDDDAVGVAEGWYRFPAPFVSTIVVPFPPEAPASTVAATGLHPVVWYRRTITRSDLAGAGLGVERDRLLLHFGAVDYRADVWLDGQYVGRHEGGHTPFTFDVTHVVAGDGGDADSWALVVRAEDDPSDVAQPRGKQDWQAEPHGIWYVRTTGIWQPVWMEAVPHTSVTDIAWVTDVPGGTVAMSLELSERPRDEVTVTVQLRIGDERLADLRFTSAEPRSRIIISLPGQANGQAYEALLWSPEHPRLIDACVTVTAADGSVDEVLTYFGLRSVAWSHGHFMLNDRPYYVRAVLDQGYWPETHLAAPSADALREEVRLIKDLGFNTVRVHQKVEDPRFLYWADRLGLLVWAEGASAYEFSGTAVERMTREWLDVLRRDVSHPSIAVWVPLNESWGVQHIQHDSRQLDHARSLYHLTKSIDPTRPVITNDGWEHADSDIWTVHDYGTSGAELAANYVDAATVRDMLARIGPLGRRMRLLDLPDRGQPVIVSEFGGVSFAPTYAGDTWGYVTVSELVRELFAALQRSPVLAGFCYTQLTDTFQEANGLTDPFRNPKLPVETIRGIVLGEGVDASRQRRPTRVVEQRSEPSAQA